MYLPRAIEEKLRLIMRQFPALLLTGPRQVGKSTVLTHLAGRDIRYLTMDDPVLRAETARDPALFLKNNPPPLLIDEVQYVPELFPYLKMQIDRNPAQGQYLMTGSQAFVLMNNVSESLAGRVGVLELQGLSLREMLKIDFSDPFVPDQEYIRQRGGQLRSPDNLWEVIHRGSMPALALHQQRDWEIYYSSYVQTYLQRDVRLLTQVADERAFLQFMTSLAARSGELFNAASIASECGISGETARRWLSILTTSRLVYLLAPYANNHLKRSIKTPKVYFMDTGLVAYLTRWTNAEVLAHGNKAGAMFETFIVSEIIKSYQNAGVVNPPLYFYRDRDQREVDLLIETNQALYPVEIKLTAAPHANMASGMSALENIPGVVLGQKTILCRYDRVSYLKDDLIALPMEYI